MGLGPRPWFCLTMVCLTAAMVAWAGCTTITEELPTRPTPQIVVAPVPVVVVVPAPLPVPESPAPAPTPKPSPEATPNPTPDPTPTPKPKPQPTPEPAPGNSTVVRVGLRVYFIECGGEQLPGSEGVTTTDVGCRIHLDATPKDSSNKPTTPNGSPNWYYSDRSIVGIAQSANDYTPTLLGKKRGSLSVSVTVDGVESNTLVLTFR
jgi:outer membrane biosynthesis protein TonB